MISQKSCPVHSRFSVSHEGIPVAPGSGHSRKANCPQGCGRIPCRAKCFLNGDSGPTHGEDSVPLSPCGPSHEAPFLITGSRPPLYELACGAGLRGEEGRSQWGPPAPRSPGSHLRGGQTVPLLPGATSAADGTGTSGPSAVSARARKHAARRCPRRNLSLFNDLTPHGLTDPVNRGLTKVIYGGSRATFRTGLFS